MVDVALENVADREDSNDERTLEMSHGDEGRGVALGWYTHVGAGRFQCVLLVPSEVVGGAIVQESWVCRLKPGFVC